MNWLKGKKTYLASAGIVLAALGAFLHNDATLLQALEQALTGLGLAALRAGVAKAEPGGYGQDNRG